MLGNPQGGSANETVHVPENFLENCIEREIVIGTHDQNFHCDEVLGCFMLMVLFPKATVKRTRDLEELAKCDVVLDVGGEYDPHRLRFDHHQRSFMHSMSSLNPYISGDIRLSSAGLVYAHFGKEVLTILIKKLLKSDEEIDQRKLNFVYSRVYSNFIKEIDAIDNGIPQFKGEPLYYINSHISNRVSHLNKEWNQKPEDFDETAAFNRAIELVSSEFIDAINRTLTITYPARELVRDAVEKRFEVHESGEIIVLERSCPWKEHFFDVEREFQLPPHIKYVVFQEKDRSWRVMGVPVESHSFAGRRFLPPSWRGLRGSQLNLCTGMEGCIFVHHNGFIGGHETKEGALEMGIKSLHNTEPRCKFNSTY